MSATPSNAGLAPADHPSLAYGGFGRPTPADFASSIVVFLVALPLCLGIALASGAPLLSGMVAGIVGGLVVGLLSPSHVQVSGPAAGLTAIVLAAIASQGSFEAFLPAVVIGGALQLGMGLVRLGVIIRYVPSSVIKGMLAGIGVILILKQYPYLLGLGKKGAAMDQGALFVGLLCLAIMFGWKLIPVKQLQVVPAPLAAVVVGTALSEVFVLGAPQFAIEAANRVALPEGGLSAFLGDLARPDWSVITSPGTWVVGVTIALVASLETLLCLEAANKLDKWRRPASPDRELIAQGVGNMVAGFIGGLPLTGVIVRSSANADSGANTRFSALTHAVWLILAVVALASLLNRIPLAALAAILTFIGFRLARPALFIESWKAGMNQFLPFTLTIAAILATDLLKGIFIGFAIALVMALLPAKARQNVMSPALRREENTEDGTTRFTVADHVVFLQKAGVSKMLAEVPANSKVVIDGTGCENLDLDVLDAIHGFEVSAGVQNIECTLVGMPASAGAGGH